MGVLIFTAVFALFVLADFGPGWIRRHRHHLPSGRLRSPGTAADPAGDDSAAEREEAWLVGKLVAGDLPRDRYRERMAKLAAQDSERYPIVVPPDAGS